MNVLSILLIFCMNNCDNRYKKGCLNLSVFQIYVTVIIICILLNVVNKFMYTSSHFFSLTISY